MNSAQQRIALITILGILGLLVVADLMGILPGRGEASVESEESAGARSLYLARAELAEKQDSLIDQAGHWKEAAQQAERQWEIARRSMVVERTVELAEARFRDRALEAVQDLNLTSLRVTPVRDRAPAQVAKIENIEVRSLSLEVKFDAANHRDVYAAIDRLERMSGMATNISALRIDGPARVQLPHAITVVLTLQAQAAVGEEGAAHG